MLENAIAEAEAIYIAKVPELRRLQEELLKYNTTPPEAVTEETVRVFLSRITHNPRGRFRKHGTHAYARYRDMSVTYNPLYDWDHKRALDLVLHEIGHLFSFHFLRHRGHGRPWRELGWVVGYTPIGGTSEKRRLSHGAFAACAGTVEPLEKPLGKIGPTKTTQNPIRRSEIDNPVRRVWEICEQHSWASRKLIIALCVEEGINPNTASTQYYHWKKGSRFI